MTNEQLLHEARTVLLFLEAKKELEATQLITEVDSKLEEKNAISADIDVQALWDQVKIASSNMDNTRYFDDVKEELNRITFASNQSTE